MDNKTFLVNAGWVETPGKSPWRWSDPKFPSCFYTIQTAAEVQQARDRASTSIKKGKK